MTRTQRTPGLNCTRGINYENSEAYETNLYPICTLFPLTEAVILSFLLSPSVRILQAS